MNREYKLFVEQLRQSLLERLGLNEKQIYFEERDENGMTPNGDRLFVECSVCSAGKEVCGIHTEEMYEDYLEGISLDQIAKTVESEIRKLKTAGFFEKTKNLNNYEKIKGDLFIRLLNRKYHKRELSRAVYWIMGDIALVLYMQVGNINGRICSMKIRRENLKEWGLDEATVFEAALVNTCIISPPRIYFWEKLLHNRDYEGECFMDQNSDFSVKKDNIIVIIIIDILFHIFKLKNGIILNNIGANFSANASDANALDKNPARVIPICIVAKNLLGDSNIL